MITLTSELEQFMKGQNLEGLKPFAVLLRNKWVEEESASESESGSVGHYELDTANPIDISDLIVKPNTLSMTLDVNEVAQYNANNVTLTLSDTKNQLVERTENSFFPSGYQLYGSRVVLYYGTDDINKTRIFTGVIKDLPTYKPEQYQVDLKLVSPLEMLKDIEAKDFSDKVIGETLTYIEDDSDGNKVYHTSGTGVGGFNGVYGNGTKLFEGVDYEISQLNSLGLPAVVTIINSDHYADTITADYYTWKTGLTVEQIIAGLVALAGYNSENEDIRAVSWSSEVRNQTIPTLESSIGYKTNGSGNLTYVGGSDIFYSTQGTGEQQTRFNLFPSDFQIDVTFGASGSSSDIGIYYLGDFRISTQTGKYVIENGINILIYPTGYLYMAFHSNGNTSTSYTIASNFQCTITKIGNSWTVSGNKGQYTQTLNVDLNTSFNEMLDKAYSASASIRYGIGSYSLSSINNDQSVNYTLSLPSAMFSATEMPVSGTQWGGLNFTLDNMSATYAIQYRTEENGTISQWKNINKGAETGETAQFIRFYLQITSADQTTNINDIFIAYLSSNLTLQLVNLSSLTVLEALQDFALISGYEFGVDRNGVFFFRPRVASTTPTYTLGHSEIAKVDTVKRNLSDFFTKLTLTFAQVPLEFYANTGQPPTLVDKYGIINKEIDKPDIVNYDNPELAQAIGPQLLEVYSSLPNVIQVTGKLNLALELGDIVSLQRNYSLIEPDSASDYVKFINQQTYYRACKITGMNYNFAKKQITYTLRDVSNQNNMPGALFNEYVYEYPIEFGVKE